MGEGLLVFVRETGDNTTNGLLMLCSHGLT